MTWPSNYPVGALTSAQNPQSRATLTQENRRYGVRVSNKELQQHPDAL